MTVSPFAGFERRAAAVIIDFLAMFFLAIAIQVSILERVGIHVSDLRPVVLAIGVLYLSVSWASPLSATPVQWLLRIHVVNKSGERLGLPYAVLRALLLIGGIIAAMTLFKVPENPKFLAISVPTLVLLFLAAATTHRQGIHDLIAGSLVVTKGAVRTTEGRNEFREYIADKDPALRAKSRPKIFRIIVAAIVLSIPLFGMYNIALMQFDRELRHRIAYAYQETWKLRTALYEMHLDRGYWATTEEELGVEIRAGYPDGGYFELEENGLIRIRFTVIPRLKRISVIVSPNWMDDELTWECRVEGEISQAILPSHCRD